MFLEDVYKDAVTNFRKITGVGITLADEGMLVNEPGDNEAREITIRNGKQTLLLQADTRGEIRDIHMPGIFKANNKDTLLICRYIPATLKTDLKKNGINYLETNGNCFINKDGFFVFINDQKAAPQRIAKTGKLATATGVKLLFALLTDEGLATATYRQIARQAGIALGAVGALMAELQQEGFILEQGKQLCRKTELINRWIELYAAILRPGLTIGKYKCYDEQGWTKDWQQKLATNKQNNGPAIFAGGEPAGAMLTNTLIPEKFILYTPAEPTEIMKALRLIPDTTGNIELRKTFWPVENNAGITVPPLLAYADLMACTDSRNIETAQIIKDHYL